MPSVSRFKGEQFHRIDHLEQARNPPGTVIKHFLGCSIADVMRHTIETSTGRADAHFEVQVGIDERFGDQTACRWGLTELPVVPTAPNGLPQATA